MRIGVLASGSGTILGAMADAGLPLGVVAVDRPCAATEVAQRYEVGAVVVERSSFGAGFDRAAYTDQVVRALRSHDVDLVAMAGFGTILAAPLFDAFPDRVLNTHPALLPAFKGWHAVEAAVAYGVKITGCTVHLATPAVDDGPILAQGAVEVRDDDTVASLHERIKEVERRLYPGTLRAIVDGWLDLDEAARRWADRAPVGHEPDRENTPDRQNMPDRENTPDRQNTIDNNEGEVV